MARLPVKSDAQHAAALAELNCVYLGEYGCEVYAERPLICRLFGTTPKLACPHGRQSDVMIASDLEQQIEMYMMSTRQVLV
jgi:Fe-S-cluster containining protein